MKNEKLIVKVLRKLSKASLITSFLITFIVYFNFFFQLLKKHQEFGVHYEISFIVIWFVVTSLPFYWIFRELREIPDLKSKFFPVEKEDLFENIKLFFGLCFLMCVAITLISIGNYSLLEEFPLSIIAIAIILAIFYIPSIKYINESIRSGKEYAVKKEENYRRLELIRDQALADINNLFETNFKLKQYFSNKSDPKNELSSAFLNIFTRLKNNKLDGLVFDKDMYEVFFDRSKAEYMVRETHTILNIIFEGDSQTYAGIKAKAREYAGGEHESINVLESYFFSLTSQLLDLLHLSDDTKRQLSYKAEELNPVYPLRSRDALENFKKRKLTENLLPAKLLFLALAVVYKKKEIMTIPSTYASESLIYESTPDTSKSLVADLELIKNTDGSSPVKLDQVITAAYYPKKPSAFICHAKEDVGIALEIYYRLEKLGIAPWIDENDLEPGVEWDSAIQQAIKNTDVILILLSEQSVTKQGYVQKEIKRALNVSEYMPENQVYIIPIQLDDVRVHA